MQSFINGITAFVWEILQDIRYSIQTANATMSGNLSLSTTNFNAFLDKPIISGDLINITMTFRDLWLYVVPILLIVLAIYLFVKFAFKLLSLFSLR